MDKLVKPAFTAATVTAVVGAVMALAVSFGAPLTETQMGAISALMTVLAPFIVYYVAHKTTAEYTTSGDVVRGPANEGPTGEVVRKVGEPIQCELPQSLDAGSITNEATASTKE